MNPVTLRKSTTDVLRECQDIQDILDDICIMNILQAKLKAMPEWCEESCTWIQVEQITSMDMEPSTMDTECTQ